MVCLLLKKRGDSERAWADQHRPRTQVLGQHRGSFSPPSPIHFAPVKAPTFRQLRRRGATGKNSVIAVSLCMRANLRQRCSTSPRLYPHDFGRILSTALSIIDHAGAHRSHEVFATALADLIQRFRLAAQSRDGSQCLGEDYAWKTARV